MMQPGDVILIYNMPYPIGNWVIDWVSCATERLGHCATVLDDGGMPTVYEAAIPVARKLTVLGYAVQLALWAGDRAWGRRRTGMRLRYQVWRPPAVTGAELEAMRGEAEKWLGVEYSMIWNYLTDSPKIHCSEMAGRVLETGLIVPKWSKPHSKITPMDVRNVLEAAGLNVVEEVTLP